MSGYWAGKSLSPEHRAKIAAAMRGRKASPEARAAMSGRTRTPEHRAKLSAALRGRKLSEEECLARSIRQKGKPRPPHVIAIMQAARPKTHSPEARAKISAAQMGRPWSEARRASHTSLAGRPMWTPEQRAEISARQKGQPKSPEHVEKMRAVRLSPEQRARISAAHRARLKDNGVRIENVRRLRTPPLPRGECAYCLSAVATTWDHVIPLSRGGAYGKANLVPSCKPCNSSKGVQTPDEWLAAGLIGDRRFAGVR